jgi:hypothetical protein
VSAWHSFGGLAKARPPATPMNTDIFSPRTAVNRGVLLSAAL